jgi:hypothetical protein
MLLTERDIIYIFIISFIKSISSNSFPHKFKFFILCKLSHFVLLWINYNVNFLFISYYLIKNFYIVISISILIFILFFNLNNSL